MTTSGSRSPKTDSGKKVPSIILSITSRYQLNTFFHNSVDNSSGPVHRPQATTSEALQGMANIAMANVGENNPEIGGGGGGSSRSSTSGESTATAVPVSQPSIDVSLDVSTINFSPSSEKKTLLIRYRELEG